MSFLAKRSRKKCGLLLTVLTTCAFLCAPLRSEPAAQGYTPQPTPVAPQPAAPAADAPAAAAAANPAPAADAAPPATAPGDKIADPAATTPAEEEAIADFEHEDTFIDIPDALRSRQFVHRAILSTIIHDTTKFNLDSWYVNHLLGFNAVYQPANRGGKSFAKYVTGAIGLAVGYLSKGGHAAELGFELSGVSNLIIDYRYFVASEKLSVWPFVGLGVGKEIGINLASVPIEAQVYQGMSIMGFGTIGALVPLVDVGIKAEARFNFYGLDRLMLTTGIGVIVFL